jgi:hypothetical protein
MFYVVLDSPRFFKIIDIISFFFDNGTSNNMNAKSATREDPFVLYSLC